MSYRALNQIHFNMDDPGIYTDKCKTQTHACSSTYHWREHMSTSLILVFLVGTQVNVNRL